MHNLFELCNILSPSLQRKHSFRIENWSDQMRGLKRETFFLPVCSEQRNVKHLEDFIAEVERRERQSELQRPEIPGGPNACGYYDQQSAEKWPGSTNRCQPSILPASEPSEMFVSVCVWVHELRAAGSRQHLELDVSAVGCSSNGHSFAGLGTWTQCGARGCLCFLCRLLESYWQPRKFNRTAAPLTW